MGTIEYISKFMHAGQTSEAVTEYNKRMRVVAEGIAPAPEINRCNRTGRFGMGTDGCRRERTRMLVYLKPRRRCCGIARKQNETGGQR
jgi:hypothetical protein